MPKVKNVEKKIWDVEGFDVCFKYNGKDVRGDKSGLPQYPYERSAKNDMTVSEYKKQRFDPNFPGFELDVLDGVGNSVTGQTKLSTVRDSYSEDDD